jgi:hypothetical protein
VSEIAQVIKRLTVALPSVMECYPGRTMEVRPRDIRALLAERERLKKKDSEWYDYAKTLLAELDRLREALEKIKQRAYGPDLDKAYHMGAIARAALTAGETK